MFRMIVYLYDVRYMKGAPGLKDYLSYFFLLPNYYFLLFPVVDYQVFCKSYYSRDGHAIAQRGVHWMARGAVQLLLYRLVYEAQAAVTPERLGIPVVAAVAARMVLVYLLYLQVSGQFHIIVGMLHLFGYDLPETNRRYLLAHSLTDFWRRINIYWKDFMVKIVYFPAYFRWRKKAGEARAQVAATALVFVITWLLHGYQYFWLKGYVRITWTDTIFWGVLGGCVMANVLVELRRPKKRRQGAVWSGWLRRASQTAATFALIVVLWSLWSSSSVEEWWDFLVTGYY
jgi:D-alanyl-lipoteichoic acid acyltransferase DltB (MBOAT superfamily)